MRMQARVQVFKIAEGQKNKDYVTLQDFATGSQFQVGLDKTEARGLKPGDFIGIDGPVQIGEYNGKMFLSFPVGTISKIKVEAK